MVQTTETRTPAQEALASARENLMRLERELPRVEERIRNANQSLSPDDRVTALLDGEEVGPAGALDMHELGRHWDALKLAIVEARGRVGAAANARRQEIQAEYQDDVRAQESRALITARALLGIAAELRATYHEVARRTDDLPDRLIALVPEGPLQAWVKAVERKHRRS